MENASSKSGNSKNNPSKTLPQKNSQKKEPPDIINKKEEENLNKQKRKKQNDETDLTNKILSNLMYENFEPESEKFRPHFHKKSVEISINKVDILDQNRFRFLISNNSDIFKNYTLYEKGNFKNIIWDDIKLVYYYYVEDYQCPVCMEQKLCCPVITNCGHIFCYPCFINFCNYHTIRAINKTNPKCPLCSKKIEISEKNLKFCEMIQCRNYTNHMQIKFHLIMRDKSSPTLFNIYFDPSLKKWKNSLKFQMKSIPLEISKEFEFSRIFSTNKKLTDSRLNGYKTELLSELKEEKEFYADESKINSIEECINIINSKIKENQEQKDFILDTVFQKEKPIENNNLNYNKFDLNSNINKDNLENNQNNNNINNSYNNFIDYNNYYLFYQEEEGDIYYLHPYIMNILLEEYGDYNSLPVVISGNILDVEMHQITQNSRIQYPFLSHLRQGSIIFFVDIDLNYLISPRTKKKFNRELNERAKYRRLLSEEEKKYEKFINKKEIREKEEIKNYISYKPGFKISQDNEEKNNNAINENNENNENNEKESEEKNEKKENLLKKLFEEKEKEEKKIELEKIEKEKEKEKLKQKENSKNFVFDANDFPELNNNINNVNDGGNINKDKGGKKGKKKGKKKFQEVSEDFLNDAFNPKEEEKTDKKANKKKSS